MKYFAVTAACGHVGKGYYVAKTFAVKAEDGRAAAKIARGIPRVKHDFKYAILKVLEITREMFQWLMAANETDPYMRASNIQEQRATVWSVERKDISTLSKETLDEEGKPYRKGRKKISRKAYENRYVYHSEA